MIAISIPLFTRLNDVLSSLHNYVYSGFKNYNNWSYVRNLHYLQQFTKLYVANYLSQISTIFNKGPIKYDIDKNLETSNPLTGGVQKFVYIFCIST